MRFHVPITKSFMWVKQGDALRPDLMNIRKKQKKLNKVKEILLPKLENNQKVSSLNLLLQTTQSCITMWLIWQDTKILAKECVSNVRHIKEAFWISVHPTQWTETRAHYLSHVYDPLLIMPTFGDRWNRRGDQYHHSNEVCWPKCTKLSIVSKIYLVLLKNFKY